MSPGKVSILVISDGPPLDDAVRRSLKESAFAVNEVCDATKALELIRQQSFSLVVLDTGRMSEASGVDLCREIRVIRQEIGILLAVGPQNANGIVEAPWTRCR